MARTVGGKGARAKGTRAENELVNILNELGIPAQRVLASGSFVGADADVKIGVELNTDGTMPDKDEAKCIMRGEVKNRKDNPERLWKFLKQNKKNRVVALRRPQIPTGSLKNQDYNEVYLICMGLSDWVDLFKRAYYNE